MSRLSEEFEKLPAHAGLQAVLAAYPAAVELYENLNYRHAGLCLSPLDSSLSAEMKAREAIERVKAGAAGRTAM